LRFVVGESPVRFEWIGAAFANPDKKRGRGHVVGLSYVFQSFPEFLLKTNALLAAEEGSLDGRGLHDCLPRFMQWANCTYEVVLVESY
jgi:hypothetical protein